MNAQELCDLMNSKRAKDSAYEQLLIPRIVCADGFSLSVQASYAHYSTPRENDKTTYIKVEVGFPSAREESLMPYAEDKEDPTGTIYAFVPTQIVAAIITDHGGVA